MGRGVTVGVGLITKLEKSREEQTVVVPLLIISKVEIKERW
jgi:hypothetical protein